MGIGPNLILNSSNILGCERAIGRQGRVLPLSRMDCTSTLNRQNAPHRLGLPSLRPAAFFATPLAIFQSMGIDDVEGALEEADANSLGLKNGRWAVARGRATANVVDYRVRTLTDPMHRFSACSGSCDERVDVDFAKASRVDFGRFQVCLRWRLLKS